MSRLMYSVLAVVVVAMGLAQALVLAQQSEDFGTPEPADAAAAEAVPQDAAPEVTAEPANDGDDSQTDALRQQYVELLRLKAQLMTEEQLQQSLAQLNNELREIEAQRKLDAIVEQLEALIESSPNTTAAAKARAMLQIGSGLGFRGGPFAPAFDPAFPRSDDGDRFDDGRPRPRRPRRPSVITVPDGRATPTTPTPDSDP